MKITLSQTTDKKEPIKNPNRLAEFPENTIGIIKEWPVTQYVGILVIRKGDKLLSLEKLIGNPNSPMYWTSFAELCKSTGTFYIETPKTLQLTIEQ